jgi:spore protease
MKEGCVEEHEKITKILVKYLSQLLNIGDYDEILIAGLGNRMVTPDALGPRTAEKILVTRHIMDSLPDHTRAKTRPVSALAPGVMGTTGIETREIIKGVCGQSKPALVMVIDALAARSTNRINTTIQISDTGLSPGAGMSGEGDGSPKSVDKGFLGVPVIAVGVPTVVDAATLVNDSLDLLLDQMIAEVPESETFYATLRDLRDGEKYHLVKRLLAAGNMFVTPKEVDETVDRLANIIANALNIALQPGMDLEDINRFMC